MFKLVLNPLLSNFSILSGTKLSAKPKSPIFIEKSVPSMNIFDGLAGLITHILTLNPYELHYSHECGLPLQQFA